MKIGFLGLGNMGLNLALNLQEGGHEVLAWNRSESKRKQAQAQGLNVVDSISAVVDGLSSEDVKVVWLMVAAGPAVDSVIFDDGNLSDLLGRGDIIIDGANSHYETSQARAAKLAKNGIRYLDCGISGGVDGARQGACIMAGGNKEAFEHVEQLFATAAMPNGYGYFGESGAGHYVKMVHNGIEYGMMQSIAEGMNLIRNSDFDVDFAKLTDVWNHGSIIESRLIGFINSGLQKDVQLDQTEPEIGSLGTGRWTVEEALKRGVPLQAIASAVFARYQSRDPKSFLFKVVQAMRAEFGGHSSTERPNQK